MRYLGISDTSRRYGIPPKVLSDLFYQRHLDDSVCPVIAGRRLIPASYLPEIEAALRERGYAIPAEVAVSA